MLKISDYTDEEIVDILRRFKLPNAAVAKRTENIIHVYSTFRGPPDDEKLQEEADLILKPDCDCELCTFILKDHGGSCILVHHSLNGHAIRLVLSSIDEDDRPHFHIAIPDKLTTAQVAEEYETPPEVN